MRNKKYMMSGGLAFSEQSDLKKLREKAAQGWNVKRFKFMGYQLEKGAPEDVIFSIDYRDFKKGEEEEYFEMFEMAGWNHVSSNAGIHLFKALPGTKPIYSDKESSVDNLVRQQKPLLSISVACVLITIISYLLSQMGPETIQTAFHVLFLSFIVITFPVLMTAGAITFHLWRAKRVHA